jgi:hypothetical protein
MTHYCRLKVTIQELRIKEQGIGITKAERKKKLAKRIVIYDLGMRDEG